MLTLSRFSCNRRENVFVCFALGSRQIVGEDSETEQESVRFGAGIEAMACAPYLVLLNLRVCTVPGR